MDIETMPHAMYFSGSNEAVEKAFNDIKELLISPPVLKAPTPDGLFCLESDTSQEGVGGYFTAKTRKRMGSD